MSDVFAALQRMSWRGREYPLRDRSLSFAHEGFDHTVQYRDFEFRDQVGAHGLSFICKIPLRQHIVKGPYKDLFTIGLPQLFRDSLNREIDTYIDPVHGAFRCYPVRYNETADPQAGRDGVDVEIEFRHSPLLQDDPGIQDVLGGLSSLKSDAGALDEEIKKADWKQEEPPEPAVNPLDAVSGVVAQSQAQIEKASAALHDFAFKLEKIEDAADRAENPENWGIRDAARRNREAASRLNERLKESPTTKLKRIVVRSERLVSDIAAENDALVEDLIGTNPGIARSPILRPGTVLFVRVAA